MKKTTIPWTDFTWNVTRGCSRKSTGCENCYAENIANRFCGEGLPYEGLIKKTTQGPRWNGKIKLVHKSLIEPFALKKPSKIFVNSMSDLFHENIPDHVIDQVFAVMALCKQHTFQILTKRPERMLQYFNEQWQPAPARQIMDIIIPAETEGETRVDQVEYCCEEYIEKFQLCDPALDCNYDENDNCIANKWEWPLKNVWLGVSVENQEMADERIPLLLDTPAAVRWVSVAPLLGPVTLNRNIRSEGTVDWLDGIIYRREDGAARKLNAKIDWVVVSGETGAKARPMHPGWVRAIKRHCLIAGVPFYFERWGEYRYIDAGIIPEYSGDTERGLEYVPAEIVPGRFVRCGRSIAGNRLDGEITQEMPT